MTIQYRSDGELHGIIIKLDSKSVSYLSHLGIITYFNEQTKPTLECQTIDWI